jgi:hypothetical protein
MHKPFFIFLFVTNAATLASFKEWGDSCLEGKNGVAHPPHVAKSSLESIISYSSIPLCLRSCGAERLVLRGGERKTRDSKEMHIPNKKNVEIDSGDASDTSDSDMSGADSQDMNEPGDKGDLSSADVLATNKALDRKLDAYARKYGLSTGQPANPLGMLLEKAARSMDAKTRFKIKKENFALEAKEMDTIKKQLKEDNARRPCRFELPARHRCDTPSGYQAHMYIPNLPLGCCTGGWRRGSGARWSSGCTGCCSSRASSKRRRRTSPPRSAARRCKRPAAAVAAAADHRSALVSAMPHSELREEEGLHRARAAGCGARSAVGRCLLLGVRRCRGGSSSAKQTLTATRD